MNCLKHIVPLVGGLCCAIQLSAQDPQLSQFHAAPQYLNPALVGNTAQDRVALNYRLQWPGVQPGFETYAVAYDHNFVDANSGLGGMVMRDVAGSNGLSFTSISMSYSYEARIDHKRALRFGLRTGYVLRGIDPSGYLFADQVIRDNAPRTIETGMMDNTSYLDMSFGSLYYSEQFWVGASVNHINRPNTSLFLEGDARIDMRTAVHGGYRFAIDGFDYRRSDTRMTIAALYKAQGKWDQFDLGAYIDHNRLTAGIWYRGLPVVKAYEPGYGNNEAMILMMGFETEQQLRFVYSYDITISKLSMRSGGAHEISLVYEWPRQAKKRRHRIVPCPKF
jgi:type IX secretion system PorP/SprF family membrane protein